MTDQSINSTTQIKPRVFRNVLVQRVLIGLLLIALVPIIVISVVNFIRTSDVLQTQAINQLSSLAESYSQQLDQFAITRRQALDQINQSAGFDNNVVILFQGISAPGYTQASTSLSNYINTYIQTPTEKIFDQVVIVDSAGKVLISTNRTLTGKNLTDSYFIRALYQTNSSLFSYEAGGLFPGQLVLITSKIYRNPLGAPGLTLIGFSSSSLPLTSLNTSQSFFNESQGYLLTADNELISADPNTGSPVVNELTSDNLSLIENRLLTSGDGQNQIYTNSSNNRVYGYYKPLSFVQSNLIIEVPQSIIIGEVQSLLPFTLILLSALMVISGLIVYIASRRMITPLTDLAKQAQTFAAGDWTYRAKIDRDDEIGQLAFSFNNMVDQLTGYYRSLEDKVEIRTQRLTLLSEIAQNASAGLNQRDILRRASELLSEKVNFPYHAFYTIDPESSTAILVSQGSKIIGSIPESNTTIPLANDSLIGWSALNKQTRISGDIRAESDMPNLSGLVESAASQMVIPIFVNEEVVALLDLQSQQHNEFDIESSTVFSTFADQLATGLRNVEMVESAQLGLKETNALYSASRQVTIAQSIDDVDKQLSILFQQTEYVSFFFDILGDQIHLIDISDPRGTRLDQSLKGFNIPLARGLTRLSATGMQILSNFKEDADFSNLSVYFERRGCSSIAMLPIVISKEMGYLLVIGSRDPKPITTSQMQPYLSFAQVVGATIERITLLSILNQRLRELNTLSAISQSATIASDSEDLFIRLHQEIKATFGENVGFAIVLNNQEQKSLAIPYFMETERLSIPSYTYTDDLFSSLVSEGKQILHRDASVIGLRTVESGDFNLTAKSWLGLPLIIGNKILGGLVLFDSNVSNRFKESDISLLNTVIPQISSSIQNTELLNSQQQALKAFEQEQFLLNSLLKNIPDEIVFKNPQGEFIRMSDSAVKRLGIDEMNTSEINESGLETHFEDQESDASVISAASPLLGKIDEVLDADGSKRWALISKIPLVSESGEVSALLKISRDVTDLVTTQNIAKRRADQLLTTSEIAREATTGNLDIDETLKRMVDLVKTRFGFYHSSIFLLDALNQFAILRESTGEAGAQLKARGHKLAVGSASIIGQTTAKGEPVVIGDVTKEANYFPNPLLPDTRSEAGIPLKLGDEVYGALDVQSDQINAFSQEDISILRILADQLAVTIQNANLYTKTQETLERHRILQQVTTAEGQNLTFEDAIRTSVTTLQKIFPNDRIGLLVPSYPDNLKLSSYAGFSAKDITEDIKKIGVGYLGLVGSEKTAQLVIDVPAEKVSGLMFAQSRSFMAVPIVYANRLLGVIDIENLEPGKYDENDQEIVTTLASNLASLIANIELVDQIRLQVDRQRQLYEISSKIRQSTDIETIMRTSLSEICNALNIRKASIELLQNQETDVETAIQKGI